MSSADEKIAAYNTSDVSNRLCRRVDYRDISILEARRRFIAVVQGGGVNARRVSELAPTA